MSINLKESCKHLLRIPLIIAYTSGIAGYLDKINSISDLKIVYDATVFFFKPEDIKEEEITKEDVTELVLQEISAFFLKFNEEKEMPGFIFITNDTKQTLRGQIEEMVSFSYDKQESLYTVKVKLSVDNKNKISDISDKSLIENVIFIVGDDILDDFKGFFDVYPQN